MPELLDQGFLGATGLRKLFLRYLPLALIIAGLGTVGLIDPVFLSARNIVNVLRQSSALVIMAIGMSAVLIGGGIDLSVPSVMALSGIFGAMFMEIGGTPAVATLVMLATGAFVGAINGYLVAFAKMVPFVVTMSTMYIVMGLDIWLTREISIPVTNFAFVDTVTGELYGVPVPVIVVVIITAFVTIMARKSLLGRWLYAVGSNPEVARYVGIPKDLIIFSTYVFAGLFSGIAAVITAARLMSASASMGKESVLLNVLGGAVVGGVSIYGGTGSFLGAAVGAIVMTLMTNIMNITGISYFVSLIARGLLVVAVVALDTIRRRGAPLRSG